MQQHLRLTLVGVVFFLSAIARGAEPPTRFGTADYIALPALLITDALLLPMSPPNPAHWTGGILFDDALRDALRVHNDSSRKAVATLSDVLVFAVAAYPFAVDVIADTWLSKHDGDNAGRLALISAEAFLGVTLIRLFTKNLVGRERPLARECAADPNYDPDCGKDSSRTSFFSGHAATSFTAAGLVCAAHEAMNLAGGSVPCYAALGAATVVSMARVVSDKHYMTDVIVGAAVGLGSGYFLPKLLHFTSSDSKTQAMAMPTSHGAPGLTLAFLL